MIHIIVATFSEANFFIDYLNLKKINSVKEFPTFFNDSFSLTVSGIGKINSSISVCHTFYEFGKIKNNCWLNIGLSGHIKKKIGDLFLVNKICDNHSQKKFFPYSPETEAIKSLDCITYDKPNFNYNDSLSDMELSGFFLAANKYSYKELIHSLKIISDNKLQSIDFKDKNKIEVLFEKKKSDFEFFFKKLKKISLENKNNIYFDKVVDKLISNIRATKSECEQIKNFMKLNYLRYNNIDKDIFNNENSGKKIIFLLKKKLRL